MNKKHGHKKFYEILEELAELHSKKNFDYAGGGDPLGNFQRCGEMIKALLSDGDLSDMKSALIFMSKQVDAVIDMIGKGRKEQVEGITDKLNDIAVYAVLARILYEERK